MVLFNYATKELTAKVVYYGPGLCGKTTNLQFIHENLPETVRGKMLSLATKTDRTLFFDFLPIDLGEIRGMKTRVQLYTVPGQVFYNETRRLVLKGADGIVFVADSQETMLGANVESFRNLEENLKAHGLSLADMPHVIQFNKRDLPKLSSIEEMNAALNRYNAPFYESVATTGIGVQDTLKAVVKLVLLHLTRKYDPKSASSPRAERPVPVAAPPPAPSPEVTRPAPPQPRVHAPQAQTIPVSGLPLSPVAQVAPPYARLPVEAPKPASHPASVPVSVDSLGDAPFGDDEIDGLVREVDEWTSVGDTHEEGSVWLGEPVEETLEAIPVEVAPVDEIAMETDSASPFATSDSAFGSSLPLGELPSIDENPVPADRDLPIEDPGPVFPDRSGGDFPPLEIDRGFDPEWTPPGWYEPEVETPETIEEAPRASAIPFAPEPPPSAEAEASAAAAEEDGVYLDEVADDADLFADPGLEVASLAAGESRDIVVPVEIRSGRETRRFKLSVRLRLDPVDGD